jgi:hypothetical protein
MAYRTLDGAGRDRSEAVLEEFTFKGGIPVHADGKVRVITKYGAGKIRASGPTAMIGPRNAGVVRNWDDNGKKFGN